MILQEDSDEKFGEIAVREKYLTKEQVDQLLKKQADSYIYFGEALVKLGVIPEDALTNHLKEFKKTQ